MPPQLEETMKTKSILYLVAVTAAALSLNITTTIGQPIDSVESLKNRAVAASPRAIEVFPWLARNRAEPIVSTEAIAKSKNLLTEVKGNRALAASPRMKELFPERALAASPRMREVFPELARGTERAIEVAPLK
jgi:hypothetical protein